MLQTQRQRQQMRSVPGNGRTVATERKALTTNAIGAQGKERHLGSARGGCKCWPGPSYSHKLHQVLHLSEPVSFLLNVATVPPYHSGMLCCGSTLLKQSVPIIHRFRSIYGPSYLATVLPVTQKLRSAVLTRSFADVHRAGKN